MPQIKIRDLALATRQDVSDDNYMVIEDSSDTKKILISDLKLIFTADNKINALQTAIDKKLADLNSSITAYTNAITNRMSTIEGTLNDLSSQLEDCKRQLGRLSEEVIKINDKIVDITDDIDTINLTLNEIKTTLKTCIDDIAELKSTVSSHTTSINELKTTVSSHTASITDINTSIAGINKTVADNYKALNDKIDKVNTDLTAYIDKKYNDALKYIDYYHHIHENPPNFDEPYSGEDPISLNYMYPIGGIYETANPDFDPDLHFPGVWKFCGIVTAHDEDGIEQVQYYTFVRIE